MLAEVKYFFIKLTLLIEFQVRSVSCKKEFLSRSVFFPTLNSQYGTDGEDEALNIFIIFPGCVSDGFGKQLGPSTAKRVNWKYLLAREHLLILNLTLSLPGAT